MTSVTLLDLIPYLSSNETAFKFFIDNNLLGESGPTPGPSNSQDGTPCPNTTVPDSNGGFKCHNGVLRQTMKKERGKPDRAILKCYGPDGHRVDGSSKKVKVDEQGRRIAACRTTFGLARATACTQVLVASQSESGRMNVNLPLRVALLLIWCWITRMQAPQVKLAAGLHMRYFKVDRRDKATLIPLIRREVATGSTVITDEWLGYKGLDAAEAVKTGGRGRPKRVKLFTHQTVCHKRNFVDPKTGAHTQAIEGQWQHLKLWIMRKMRGCY